MRRRCYPPLAGFQPANIHIKLNQPGLGRIANLTRSESPMLTHPGTIQARHCLTAVICDRETVPYMKRDEEVGSSGNVNNR